MAGRRTAQQLQRQQRARHSSSEDEMYLPPSRVIPAPPDKGHSPPGSPDTPPFVSGGFNNFADFSDSIYQQYGSGFYRERFDSRASIVDDLLYEIYDRCYYHRDSVDSDTFTECSSTSDAFFGRSDSIQLDYEKRHSRQLHPAFLESKGILELRRMVSELHHRINHTSARLVRQLKRKDRHLARLQKNCDVVTAVLQAASLKRPIDMKMRFSLEPLPGDECFQQWTAAMKAVARLPMGIPPQFRKKVWLSLADQYIASIKVDWEKTKRFAFNERSNPDDNKLGLQIVKDLHRTGCSGFSGQDNEDDRAVLKRVLLGYARWNKQVGYCQGFNMLAALILDVMDRKEDDALKVMIFLIDHVLPESYFANNLRALSVDMAVFRELLSVHLPTLSHHLDKLQAAARDHNTGANYEPPLTNVFTMQWFLTIFATCLPKPCALRVWDSVILEGSEVLLRTALAIWGKLQSRILSVHSADEFYMTMGVVTQDMLDSNLINADQLIKTVYTMAHFPFPGLAELREKYTYNITPFTAAMATGQRPTKKGSMNIFSDEDEIDEDEVMDNITCFSGVFASQISPNRSRPLSEEHRSASAYDISKVSPGAYGANPESQPAASAAYMERMTMDIDMLKKQYSRLRQRQKQAHIIMTAASAKHMAKRKKPGEEKPAIVIPSVAPIESPVALNHLFLTRTTRGGKNRHVAKAPNISPYYMKSCLVGSQLNALTTRTDPVVPQDARHAISDDPSEGHQRHRRSSNHSIDSFMSEASNNTRGSVANTLEITSDAETIGDGSECASESSVKTDTCVLKRSDSVNSDSIGDKDENQENLEENASEITSPKEEEHNSDDSSEVPKEMNDSADGSGNSHTKDSHSASNTVLDTLETSNITDSSETLKDNTNCLPDTSEQETSDSVTDAKNDNECKVDNLSSQQESQVENNNTLKSETVELESSESAAVDSANSVQSSPPRKPLTLQLPQRNGQISRSQEMMERNGSKEGQQLTPNSVSPVTPVSPNLPYTFYRSHSSLSDSSSSDFSAPNSPIKSSQARVFNPFPVRHVNKKKMQNSIRLGLYSADTATQVTCEPRGFQQPQKPIKNIGRAQINACLHRQYMVEVKQGNNFK